MKVRRSTAYADALISHMKTCKACTAAKVARDGRWCARGAELIKMTTEERHGRAGA